MVLGGRGFGGWWSHRSGAPKMRLVSLSGSHRDPPAPSSRWGRHEKMLPVTQEEADPHQTHNLLAPRMSSLQSWERWMSGADECPLVEDILSGQLNRYCAVWLSLVLHAQCCPQLTSRDCGTSGPGPLPSAEPATAGRVLLTFQSLLLLLCLISLTQMVKLLCL